MNQARTNRLRDPLTAVTLFIATAAFTLWQNTRVAVLWDISFLLDTSYRFSLGQLPYRDFPFSYAPLTFLLHTAIIELFGRVYFPHILYAAFAGATATVLTWRILLHLLKPLANEAWLLSILLSAPLAVLGIYAIYPYPIYDSDCVLAVLITLYLFQRAGTSSARNFLAGSACVVPLFFKQNIGLPFLLVTLVAIAALAVARRLRRATLAPQLWFFTGSASMFAVALLTIHATVGLHNYIYWTITFAAQRRLPGLRVILSTYSERSLLWTIPAAIAALVTLRSQRLNRKRWAHPAAIFLLAAPFLWTIVSLALDNDPSDRSDQLLSLWPHLLILAAAMGLYYLRPRNLLANPTFDTVLPLILLAAIHGAFLSQELWGSTYALWPLLTLLIAALLIQVPTVARPMAALIAFTFLLCGGLYAMSHDRLSYNYFDGPEAHATLPQLKGLTTPGPWIPAFEELVRFTNAEIPPSESILLVPGEDPFYFTTGRTPKFPVLLFDPTIDPYTPQQTLEEARVHNIRWLIVNRNLQLNSPPHPQLPEITSTLEQDFTLYRTLSNYEIYRHK